MTTHIPYAPEKKVLKYFNFTKRDYSIIRSIFIEGYKLRISLNMNLKKFSKESYNKLNKIYNGCVYQCDIIVKEIFNLLNKSKLLDNSYIIITSDHGEHLGNEEDHFLWQHSTLQSVYKPVIDVPLLIYHPSFNKKIIKKQVQLKDLFHTILHMTGINNNFLEKNNSILYQIKNNTTPKYIFGEYLKSEKYINNIIATSREFGKKMKAKNINSKMEKNIYFVRSNKHKYINFNNKFEEFYDIESDPYEQTNILDKNNEDYKSMKSYLEKCLSNNKNMNILEGILIRKEKDTLKKVITKLRL